MTNKDMALFWLSTLRHGTIAYEDAVIKVRSYLKAAGLTLADVGASEAVLEDGFKRGCAMSMRKTYTRSLQFYIKQGNLKKSAFTGYDFGFTDAR
jgi:hypothetical protein